jgi:hypothetical protein
MIIVYVRNLLLWFGILLLIGVICLINKMFITVRLWIDGLVFMRCRVFWRFGVS